MFGVINAHLFLVLIMQLGYSCFGSSCFLFEPHVPSGVTARPNIFRTKYFSHGGDGELRTSVYPSNFAPIATKLRQRAFQTICKFRFFDAEIFFLKKISDFFFGFSSFSVHFRGARLFLTSKSSSSRFFALDGQIFRSVRPLGLLFRLCTVRT